MSLKSLDEILQAFPGITEEDRALVEELHAALSGGVKRDVLDNHAEPIKPATLNKISGRFSEFMSDPKNQAFFLKR